MRNDTEQDKFPRDPEDLRHIEQRDAIARRAFEIWEQDGRPEARADEHWRRAESEILHVSLGP